jgi:uncharacterized protein (UPF0332 family)
MVFDWKEFLGLAKLLQGNLGLPVEAAKRSAVSRAYYAAFCYARSYAEKYLGFQREKSPSGHSLLRKFLGSKISGGKDIEDKFRDLHEWRKLCDYEDTVDDLDIMVDNAITTAEEIIGRLTQGSYAR